MDRLFMITLSSIAVSTSCHPGGNILEWQGGQPVAKGVNSLSIYGEWINWGYSHGYVWIAP